MEGKNRITFPQVWTLPAAFAQADVLDTVTKLLHEAGVEPDDVAWLATHTLVNDPDPAAPIAGYKACGYAVGELQGGDLDGHNACISVVISITNAGDKGIVHVVSRAWASPVAAFTQLAAWCAGYPLLADDNPEGTD